MRPGRKDDEKPDSGIVASACFISTVIQRRMIFFSINIVSE